MQLSTLICSLPKLLLKWRHWDNLQNCWSMSIFQPQFLQGWEWLAPLISFEPSIFCVNQQNWCKCNQNKICHIYIYWIEEEDKEKIRRRKIYSDLKNFECLPFVCFYESLRSFSVEFSFLGKMILEQWIFLLRYVKK